MIGAILFCIIFGVLYFIIRHTILELIYHSLQVYKIIRKHTSKFAQDGNVLPGEICLNNQDTSDAFRSSIQNKESISRGLGLVDDIQAILSTNQSLRRQFSTQQAMVNSFNPAASQPLSSIGSRAMNLSTAPPTYDSVINEISALVWPFFVDAARKQFIQLIEPEIKQHLPKLFRDSFRFINLDLGPVPPKITNFVVKHNIMKDPAMMNANAEENANAETGYFGFFENYMAFNSPAISYDPSRANKEKLQNKMRTSQFAAASRTHAALASFSKMGESEIQITMKMEVDISTDIAFKNMGMESSITHIKMIGDGIVLLRPFLTTFPFLGAISAGLSCAPQLDFQFKGFAKLTKLRLIDRLVSRTIEQKLISLAVNPNLQTIKMKDQEDLFDRITKSPAFVARVEVLEARNLPPSNHPTIRAMDPYVIIKVSNQVAETRFIPNTMNPVWNETYDFLCADFDQRPMFEMWDYDTLNFDPFVGRTSCSWREIFDSGFRGLWLNIQLDKVQDEVDEALEAGFQSGEDGLGEQFTMPRYPSAPPTSPVTSGPLLRTAQNAAAAVPSSSDAPPLREFPPRRNPRFAFLARKWSKNPDAEPDGGADDETAGEQGRASGDANSSSNGAGSEADPSRPRGKKHHVEFLNVPLVKNGFNLDRSKSYNDGKTAQLRVRATFFAFELPSSRSNSLGHGNLNLSTTATAMATNNGLPPVGSILTPRRPLRTAPYLQSAFSGTPYEPAPTRNDAHIRIRECHSFESTLNRRSKYYLLIRTEAGEFFESDTAKPNRNGDAVKWDDFIELRDVTAQTKVSVQLCDKRHISQRVLAEGFFSLGDAMRSVTGNNRAQEATQDMLPFQVELMDVNHVAQKFATLVVCAVWKPSIRGDPKTLIDQATKFTKVKIKKSLTKLKPSSKDPKVGCLEVKIISAKNLPKQKYLRPYVKITIGNMSATTISVSPSEEDFDASDGSAFPASSIFSFNKVQDITAPVWEECYYFLFDKDQIRQVAFIEVKSYRTKLGFLEIPLDVVRNAPNMKIMATNVKLENPVEGFDSTISLSLKWFVLKEKNYQSSEKEVAGAVLSRPLGESWMNEILKIEWVYMQDALQDLFQDQLLKMFKQHLPTWMEVFIYFRTFVLKDLQMDLKSMGIHITENYLSLTSNMSVEFDPVIHVSFRERPILKMASALDHVSMAGRALMRFSGFSSKPPFANVMDFAFLDPPYMDVKTVFPFVHEFDILDTLLHRVMDYFTWKYFVCPSFFRIATLDQAKESLIRAPASIVGQLTVTLHTFNSALTVMCTLGSQQISLSRTNKRVCFPVLSYSQTCFVNCFLDQHMYSAGKHVYSEAVNLKLFEIRSMHEEILFIPDTEAIRSNTTASHGSNPEFVPLVNMPNSAIENNDVLVLTCKNAIQVNNLFEISSQVALNYRGRYANSSPQYAISIFVHGATNLPSNIGGRVSRPYFRLQFLGQTRYSKAFVTLPKQKAGAVVIQGTPAEPLWDEEELFLFGEIPNISPWNCPQMEVSVHHSNVKLCYATVSIGSAVEKKTEQFNLSTTDSAAFSSKTPVLHMIIRAFVFL